LLTLRGAMPRAGTARQPLCVDIDGFSPHAAVRVEAHDRKRLEQLCRYITRAALSDERVQFNAARQVELKLKTPWRDGTIAPGHEPAGVHAAAGGAGATAEPAPDGLSG
jgi:Putative transposase